MNYSSYTIFSKLRDSENYFLVNVLSGSADILGPDEAARFRNRTLTREEEAGFREKGYIIDPNEENTLYRKAYLDFIDQRDAGEIQLFFVPTYGCNFNCSYCYQDGYAGEPEGYHAETTEAFFRYIDSHFSHRDKYITLFGGEPLLSGAVNRGRIETILQGAAERGLDTAVVTNGYHLEEYVPLLRTKAIREVQVTLDGPREVHDRRRTLKSGAGTFDAIVSGIDAALQADIPINLRAVIDRENISALPDLALFAREKGWNDSPLVKTQLGRNYELHYCQKQASTLYSRLEMYEDLYLLIQNNPQILEFHKPAYSLSRFLFENGELPEPLFDSCPGCKTEWAFDYRGNIYSCTATVGKPGEELGTFYPEESINQEVVDQWEERDITAIDECRTCSLQLACGGGCASVAKNRTGTIQAPDCRPVKELLELGLSLYNR